MCRQLGVSHGMALAWQKQAHHRQIPDRTRKETGRPRSRPPPTSWHIPTSIDGVGGGGETHRYCTNGPGRDPESCRQRISDGQPKPGPNMPFGVPHGPMQHVIAGTRPGTIPGVLSACYEPHVIPSCLVLSTSEQRKGNICAWVDWVVDRGAGLSAPFLSPSLPHAHICCRIYTHLLASRGVKISECLGIASSDGKGGVSLLSPNRTSHLHAHCC